MENPMITMLQITQLMVQQVCPNQWSKHQSTNAFKPQSSFFQMVEHGRRNHTVAGLPLELFTHNSSGPLLYLYWTAFLKPSGRENPLETLQSMAHAKAKPVRLMCPPSAHFPLTRTSKSQEHDRGIIKLILHLSGSFSSPDSDSNLEKCSSDNRDRGFRFI